MVMGLLEHTGEFGVSGWVRYRDGAGNWNDSWTSEPGDRLPRAVEVRMNRTGRAPLVMLFLTAPALPPPPPTPVEVPGP